MSQLRVKDSSGRGLGSIPIRLADEHGTSEQALFDFKTNDDGSQSWPIWQWSHAKGYTLHVNTGDYRNPTYGSDVRYIPPTAGDYADQDFTLARVGQQGFLTRDGRVFRDAAGQRWQFKGYSCQTLTAEVAHGRGIDACLDEAQDLGYNTIVSLCMDLSEWGAAHGFGVDPRDPNWQRWFETTLDACETRGLRIFPAMFQQAQALSSAEKRAAWEKYCAVVKGRWHVIARMGNEKNVNAWDPNELNQHPDLGGCLLSLGSYGIDNAPQPPRRDIIEWEPPRSPRAKAFSDSGGAGWYMIDGYPGFPAVDEILIVSEPPFFHESQFDWWGDERWTKDADALTLGLNIGANFEGGAFGSSASLECKRNGPNARRCAEQFLRGLEAGFVR